jgi:hypothetical protein
MFPIIKNLYLMFQSGWSYQAVGNIGTLVLYAPGSTKEDCILTAVCVYMTGLRYERDEMHKAAKHIGIGAQIFTPYITAAADDSNPFSILTLPLRWLFIATMKLGVFHTKVTVQEMAS